MRPYKQEVCFQYSCKYSFPTCTSAKKAPEMACPFKEVHIWTRNWLLIFPHWKLKTRRINMTWAYERLHPNPFSFERFFMHPVWSLSEYSGISCFSGSISLDCKYAEKAFFSFPLQYKHMEHKRALPYLLGYVLADRWIDHMCALFQNALFFRTSH